MKSYIWLLCMLLGLCQPAWAQKHSVIYLKNGSIIRGVRVITPTDSLLNIQTTEGSVLHLAQADIVKIDKDVPVAGRHRWFLEADWGLGLGKGHTMPYAMPDHSTQRMVSVQMRGGYQWNAHWMTSLGMGIDAYKDLTFWPLSARGTYLPLKGHITPVISAEAGYGFRSSKIKTTGNGIPSQEMHASGGWMLSPTAGVLIRTSRRTSFIISAGYRQQSYVQHFSNALDETRTRQDFKLRRFFISTGWVF